MTRTHFRTARDEETERRDLAERHESMAREYETAAEKAAFRHRDALRAQARIHRGKAAELRRGMR